MKQQQHTLAFVKRQAKNLKKKSGISHMKALDTISKELGYSNWKHCLQSIRQKSIPKKENISEVPQLSFTDGWESTRTEIPLWAIWPRIC